MRHAKAADKNLLEDIEKPLRRKCYGGPFPLERVYVKSAAGDTS
jgi:hypothetical protein